MDMADLNLTPPQEEDGVPVMDAWSQGGIWTRAWPRASFIRLLQLAQRSGQVSAIHPSIHPRATTTMSACAGAGTILCWSPSRSCASGLAATGSSLSDAGSGEFVVVWTERSNLYSKVEGREGAAARRGGSEERRRAARPGSSEGAARQGGRRGEGAVRGSEARER